jgi:hypothetical protein
MRPVERRILVNQNWPNAEQANAKSNRCPYGHVFDLTAQEPDTIICLNSPENHLAWLPHFDIFFGRFLGGNRPRSLYFTASFQPHGYDLVSGQLSRPGVCVRIPVITNLVPS